MPSTSPLSSVLLVTVARPLYGEPSPVPASSTTGGSSGRRVGRQRTDRSPRAGARRRGQLQEGPDDYDPQAWSLLDDDAIAAERQVHGIPGCAETVAEIHRAAALVLARRHGVAGAQDERIRRAGPQDRGGRV